MKLKIIMILTFMLVYGLFFYMNTQDRDTRIKLALDKEVYNLKLHYDVTKSYFLTDAETISDNISKNKKVIEIFSKAQKASKEQRDILRDELYTYLTPMYKRLQRRGILQFMFVFPNNRTFLRMHKPSKYGDDLTDIRYSFKYANEMKKPIEGFEKGRTTHAFRYVFPFFDENKNHIGAVEVSLSSFAMQEKFLHINKVHTHFLVHKDIFDVKAWKIKDMSQKYIPSIEHKDYMFTITEHSDERALKWHSDNVLPMLKDEIAYNISLKKPFAVYKLLDDSAKVISFFPIRDTQREKVAAYLVSYTKSNTIYNISKNYRNLNIVIFIAMLILFYATYKNSIHKRELMLEVDTKTKDLKELNDSLENKVEEKIAELREQKEHIEIIVESNNNAIIAIDRRGVITTYNKKAEEIFGWSKEEMLGSQNLLNIIPPKYKQGHTEALNNYLKTGILKNKALDVHQVEGLNRDGEIFPIRVSIGSIFKKDDTVIIANISDISQEKKQEELLNHQAKMVAMGEMIGNIAHQWRQPLTVISMCSNNMMMDVEMEEVSDKNLARYSTDINRQVKYLSQTIDDFKNFIKGDRVKAEFTLNELVENFLTLVQGSIKSNNIELISSLKKDILINGYKNELTQCMINIYNNAKDVLKEKVEDERMIFISTALENEKAVIKIKDNAGGIADEIMPKIFDPYFTTKHQSIGTGLGLHMTYNLIVDGMGGNIEVSNQTYKYDDKEYSGAEFIITLSLA